MMSPARESLAQGWLVARREIRERARTRGFRISTLLMLLVVIAMVALPGLLDTSNTRRDVGVSGTTGPAFEQALARRASADEPRVRVQRYDDRVAGEKALREGHLDLLVVDMRRLEWLGKPDVQLQARASSAIQLATVKQRAATAGVDTDVVAQLLSPVPVTTVQLDKTPGRSPDDEAAAAFMTAALLAAIVIYGNLVLTGVAEEKSTRVVEVLLARVTPKALLGGKVVGIGLLGFGQLALTAVAALVASTAIDSIDLPAVSGEVLGWVLVWFVLGYALYAMIYGALGSLVSRSEDAQAVAGPVGYVLVGGYWASLLAVGADAGGPWARALSLFPPTAPLAMPGRIALGATTWWEPPLAVVLTVCAVIALVGVAGRVYQRAVLHTGSTLRLRDVWSGTRQPDRATSITAAAADLADRHALSDRTRMRSILLAAIGAVTAAGIFALTHDVVWSIVPLLLATAAVRRVRRHR